jgi:hypothetical protein
MLFLQGCYEAECVDTLKIKKEGIFLVPKPIVRQPLIGEKLFK